MKRQNGKNGNLSVPARIAAWMTTLALTIAMTFTLIGWTCVSILSSEDLHVQTATHDTVIDGQMERVGNVIRELAEEYSFPADDVIAALDRNEFIRADREMAEWLNRITTEGVMDDEIPAWSADSLLPVIESLLTPENIPADQNSAEVAQEIGFALEKHAKRTMMPIRQTLITLGFRYMNKRIDIPGAIRLISQMPQAGFAACLLLAGIIALLTARNIRTSLKFYGSAFGGAGLSSVFALLMIRSLGIMKMIRESSKSMSDQVGVMMQSAGTGYMLGIAVLLAAGSICLLLFTREKADRNTDGGANETEENRLQDPV